MLSVGCFMRPTISYDHAGWCLTSQETLPLSFQTLLLQQWWTMGNSFQMTPGHLGQAALLFLSKAYSCSAIVSPLTSPCQPVSMLLWPLFIPWSKWWRLHRQQGDYIYIFLCACAQSCLTLCSPMACSLPGSSAHGIFQARTLEWVAISSSRGTSQPKDQTHVSCLHVGRWILNHCGTWDIYFSQVLILA